MFTGLIEEIGTVKSLKSGVICIESPGITEGLKIGDSVAVNGCCLTATHVENHRFTATIVKESLAKTSLGDLVCGSQVNLERPLRLQDRLDGHFVQGHVDGTGKILSKEKQEDGSTLVTVKTPPHLMAFLSPKGSIAVDGVSLTLVDCKASTFSFAMIPHTEKMTILGCKEVGSRVNLEADMLVKHLKVLIDRSSI